MKPVLYISGPMTGIADFNFPEFNRVATLFRKHGYPVINPADFGVDSNQSWAYCLQRDLLAMFHAGRVVTLDGWERSKGASLEVYVAKALGIEVVSYGHQLRAILTAHAVDQPSTVVDI